MRDCLCGSVPFNPESVSQQTASELGATTSGLPRGVTMHVGTRLARPNVEEAKRAWFSSTSAKPLAGLQALDTAGWVPYFFPFFFLLCRASELTRFRVQGAQARPKYPTRRAYDPALNSPLTASLGRCRG